MEKDCEEDTPYSVSSLIYGKVKQIQIVIWSHDQGFSHFPQRHGLFEDSRTWCSLGVEEASGAGVILGDIP